MIIAHTCGSCNLLNLLEKKMNTLPSWRDVRLMPNIIDTSISVKEFLILHRTLTSVGEENNYMEGQECVTIK